jgi:Flp pilus assembly protein TadB
MPKRSIARHYSHPFLASLAATLLLVLCGAAGAQTLSNAERDAAEQRRIQEREARQREARQREARQREQQEKARDIRLAAAVRPKPPSAQALFASPMMLRKPS